MTDPMDDLRQASAEVVGPTDEELQEEWGKAVLNLPGASWSATAVAFARAVLARYGHQPAPPVEGEVAELVEWLRDDLELHPAEKRRAADLLEQRHPAPVPVSERLPGPEDCDAEGRCWWFCFECPGEHSYWILAKEVYCDPTYWLPANALPLPQVEVEA